MWVRPEPTGQRLEGCTCCLVSTAVGGVAHTLLGLCILSSIGSGLLTCNSHLGTSLQCAILVSTASEDPSLYDVLRYLTVSFSCPLRGWERHCTVLVWMRSVTTISGTYILGPEGVALFGEAEEAWLCWRVSVCP